MKSTKRPAYQWYPGDAQRDTALRSCCLEARGLWREMLDLMHDGEPYGFLTAGGVPIGDKQLAGMVGITTRRCTTLLVELETRSVFSRTEEGVIYSRRMVRDEHIRSVRAAGGPKSLENENVPRPKDGNKDGSKDTFTPSSGGSPAVAVAVASAEPPTTKPLHTRKQRDEDPAFSAAWAALPKRSGSNPRGLAVRAWSARVAEGVKPEDLLAGANRYAAYCIARGMVGTEYVMQAASFFGPEKRGWEQQWQAPPPRTGKAPPQRYDYTPTDGDPTWAK